MKKSKRILSMFLALVMIIGMVLPVFAATEGEATITIHKIKVSDISKFPIKHQPGQDKIIGLDGKTEYSGGKIEANNIAGFFGEGSEELENITFTYWKISKEQYDTMTAKSGDYDTVEEVNDYLQDENNKGKDVTTGADNAGAVIETGVTDNTANYYWVVEKTKVLADGSTVEGYAAVPFGIALPLYNKDGSINKDVHVYPKNTIVNQPKIDKNFAKDNMDKAAQFTNDTDQKYFTQYENYLNTKATLISELGKKIPYEVKTKVLAGSEYQNLTWTDTMTNGLSFNTTEGVTITAKYLKDGQEQALAFEAVTDYTLTQDERGFTLKFEDAGLKKVSDVTKPKAEEGQTPAKAEDVEFTLTYSATLNGNAVVNEPEKNNIKLEYGHEKGKEIEKKPVTPSNGNLNVEKTWDGGTAPNDAIATFVLEEGANSYAVTLKSGQTTGEFNLGNGISFQVTGEFKGTFTGLDNTKTYTIHERVSGYTPEYTENVAGSVKIKNVKSGNPEPLNPEEPKVVTYGKKFVKTDESNNRLAGAEFVVKNADNKYLALKDVAQYSAEKTAYETAKAAYEKAVADWNAAVKEQSGKTEEEVTVKFDGDTQPTVGKTAAMLKIADLHTKYFAAFDKAANAYEWVDSKDNKNIVKLISDKDGKFEIQGLEKGSYSLEEITAPEGYAKLDPTDERLKFTVDEDSYTKGIKNPIDYEANNGKNDAQQIKNMNLTIPQTGGIGTVIFAVVGIALMGGAVVAMKKRNSAEG